MATIRKRGDKWQAQVRKKGAEPSTKSFFLRRDAVAWGRQQETAIDLGRPESTERSDYTLGDLLARYQAEITPNKKGRDAEARRLRRLRTDVVANTPLAALDGPALSAFRDRRVKDGLRACQYDLVIIRHAINIGRLEWGIRLSGNPVADIRVPNGIRSRTRRLVPGELQALAGAASTCRNRLVWCAVELAIETGMRRSELLRLEWDDVDFDARLAHLHDTKNGKPRSVPLTAGAIETLRSLPRTGSSRVLPLTECALRQAWERLVARAEIDDLHFHDLRHEAISRFFELGLSLSEVALISGHRDPRMLFRYTHLRASDVVAKLEAIGQP